MKKAAFVVTLSCFFLIFSTSSSFAWDHYYHRYGGGNVLVPLSVGLIAGAVIAGAVAQPPPPAVIYQQAPPAMVAPPVTYYAPPPPPQSAEIVINQVAATTGVLNIRSGPGLDTPVIDQVRHGEVLDVVGASPGWLYVRTTSGLHGWVMTKFTSVRSTPAG